MIRKHLKAIIIGAIFISIIVAYSIIEIYIKKDNEEVTIGKNTVIYNIDTDTLPFTQKELYDQIFDINNTISISIDMTNSEIKKLENDFETYKNSAIYRMANVTISITIPNDKTYAYYIEQVGIRLKGNTSRDYLYNETDGILNLNHFKLKFDETFDDTSDGYSNGEYYINTNGTSTWNKDKRNIRKNRIFGNMEKIDIKWNKNFDTTYLREYYANKLFRSEGIAAPYIGLAATKINISDKPENSEYLGVYSVHETIDSKFIKNNLLDTDNNYIINPNGDYSGGDLYKAKWDNEYGEWIGANLTLGCSYGVDDDLNEIDYNYDLKTNKKKSDFSSISNLLNGLSNVSSKDDLEKYVDMDYFVKFAAVAYAVGNGDDMRNNYTNYYLYFYTDNSDAENPVQKAIVIPYDYDRCFGVTLDRNFDWTGMTAMNPYSILTAALGNQENPLYKASVCEGGYYVQEYTEALKEVLNNPLFSIDSFTKYYNIAKNNYDNKVTPSKDFNNLINLKNSLRAIKGDFYFAIDTNKDKEQINTTSIDTITQNLIIADYFTRIRSTISDAIN